MLVFFNLYQKALHPKDKFSIFDHALYNNNLLSDMLTVIAKIFVKEDKIDEAKNSLFALIAPTLKEAGCIDYVLHQSNDDPQLFFFYENWTDRESLENHLANVHIAEFSAKAEDLLASSAELFFLSKV